MARATPDWNALQGEISGDVILPESPDYESARKSAIARFHDVRPQAVVSCETSEDISETISFARRTGLRTATRSGGHCFAGRSSTTGVIVDVSPMRTVSVSDGVATVGAGASLGEVYDALDEQGLTIPAGCGPTVGISGLTLGGGLGILGRKHSLTSDHLLRALPTPAHGRRRSRGLRCREGGRKELDGVNVGHSTPVRLRTRLPELPRPGSEGLGARLLRSQLWPPGAHQE